MARPINSKVNLKDGYYIEVCNIGANSGIKIRRDTLEGIQIALKKYKKFYDVNYMGKIENGKKIIEK
ncbi:MAG: hypothetical protein KFF73_18225 [Cyclobacteriaceae bacterium]|nr:hypothetical protein [Cyclobacteriaceae bacterium]